MRHFILTLLMCGMAMPAFAASACYTIDEAEAEQGIRIQSELMVIGLNCQHLAKSSNGGNLYVAYRKFADGHGKLFRSYENRLLEYFKRTNDKNPEKSLNDLRTKLANKVSYDAANMRPDLFCARYGKRITQVERMNETMVRQWAGTIFPGHPVSKPVCK